MLAVIWGIRRMRDYLEGYPFTVITDHQSLRWLQKLDVLTGRLGRWAFKLQQFDIEIKYRKYRNIAESCRRRPVPTTDHCRRCPAKVRMVPLPPLRRTRNAAGIPGLRTKERKALPSCPAHPRLPGNPRGAAMEGTRPKTAAQKSYELITMK